LNLFLTEPLNYMREFGAVILSRLNSAILKLSFVLIPYIFDRLMLHHEI
jgi:hypothetical protein